MNKFIKFAIFTGAVMLGTSSVSLATFSDMPKMENYEDAINYLVDNGIVSGYPDNTFRPDNFVTRAEFSKMIVLEGVYEDNDPQVTIFDDAVNHWASDYIRIAVENGIINGYKDNTFKPNNNITYGEAATMLIRSLGMEDELDASLSYPDNYMQLAEEIGLFKYFATNDLLAINPARRDNVALMLWNKATYDEAHNDSENNNTENSGDVSQGDTQNKDDNTNDEIDTRKLHLGIVTERILRRGEWYIKVDSLDGLNTYKLYDDYNEDPKCNAFIVYTLTKSNEMKLKKFLLTNEIDDRAFEVEDVDDELVLIKGESDVLDLELKKFKTETREIDLDDYTYFVIDMLEKNVESKDENGDTVVNTTYEFDSIEEVVYDKIDLDVGDKLCFDDDTGIALIIKY